MNILLSRLLTYLNGTLIYDNNYKICTFIIFHYLEMEDLSLDDFLQKGQFTKKDVLAFISLLGFDDYDTFKNTLTNHHQTRLNQIRVRLLGIQPEILLKNMEKTISDEEMMNNIATICQKIYKAKRIVVFGALYPISIAIELQTDMISFGKPFIQYHNYDDIELDKDDVAIVISATGRYIESFKKSKQHVHLEKAQQILITQNKKYLNQYKDTNCQVIYVPGQFDSIQFNYQIMTICDLIRVQYFQQYYL